MRARAGAAGGRGRRAVHRVDRDGPRLPGRGVGAALLEHVERAYRGRSRHLFLCVSSFNPRARRFYERHGFAAVGTLKAFLIDEADEILMHKRLAAAGPA